MDTTEDIYGSSAFKDDTTVNDAIPENFSVISGEWYYRPPVPEAKPEYVCRHFTVTARLHDARNGGWGRILEFHTDAEKPTSLFIADALVHDSPRKLAMYLGDAGLAIRPRTAAYSALQLLLSLLPGTLYVYAMQSGWTRNDKGEIGFVLPSGAVIGAEGIMLRPERRQTACIPKGSLRDWQREVAAHAVGNSRMAMALAIPFAAPLLYDTNLSNGGFHFVGESQIGKTTLTQASASVIGNPAEPPEGLLTTWHATQNAVEAIFARANDCVLPMDEMSQAPANDVAAIIYKLGNGSGKSRMRADSSFRDGYQWRILALSTGEEKAENKIRQAKQIMTAGVDARMANIPADAGKGMGVFEALGPFAAPQALSDHLRSAAKKQYGTALPAFIERLVKDRLKPEFIAGIKRDCARFVAEYVPAAASSQVKSVANRFALAAVAGELAIAWDILPWPVGTATLAAVNCMRDWLDDRGSVGQGEQAAVIERLREYLGANMLSKFPPSILDSAGNEINRSDICGIRDRDDNFCIMKDQWKKIMPDVPAARVMRILHAAGLITKQPDGSYLREVDLRHRNVNARGVRCYVINRRVLE